MCNQAVSSCNFVFSNYEVVTLFLCVLSLAGIQGLIFLIYVHVEDSVELLKYQTQLTICLKEILQVRSNAAKYIPPFH